MIESLWELLMKKIEYRPLTYPLQIPLCGTPSVCLVAAARPVVVAVSLTAVLHYDEALTSPPGRSWVNVSSVTPLFMVRGMMLSTANPHFCRSFTEENVGLEIFSIMLSKRSTIMPTVQSNSNLDHLPGLPWNVVFGKVSPYLFLLSAQLLCDHIKCSNLQGISTADRSVLISQYIDDTPLFFLKDSSQVPLAIDIIEQFSVNY